MPKSHWDTETSLWVRKYTFDEYMANVSAEMFRLAQVRPEDIDDYDYATAWQSGDAFWEVARDALENAGWPDVEVEEGGADAGRWEPDGRTLPNGDLL